MTFRRSSARPFTAGYFGIPEHEGKRILMATCYEQNREVRCRDIVLWVNLGMHHLTRAEDQPVMPTVWHSFKLRPLNFFNRNPALDLKAP